MIVMKLIIYYSYGICMDPHYRSGVLYAPVP